MVSFMGEMSARTKGPQSLPKTPFAYGISPASGGKPTLPPRPPYAHHLIARNRLPLANHQSLNPYNPSNPGSDNRTSISGFISFPLLVP